MEHCDLIGCNKRAVRYIEDMGDGEYLHVCSRHFRVCIAAGGYRAVT